MTEPARTEKTPEGTAIDLSTNPVLALDQLTGILMNNARDSLGKEGKAETENDRETATYLAEKIVEVMNSNRGMKKIVFAAGCLAAFKSFTEMLAKIQQDQYKEQAKTAGKDQ